MPVDTSSNILYTITIKSPQVLTTSLWDTTLGGERRLVMINIRFAAVLARPNSQKTWAVLCLRPRHVFGNRKYACRRVFDHHVVSFTGDTLYLSLFYGALSLQCVFGSSTLHKYKERPDEEHTTGTP